jgi:hypothetical protein
MRGRQTAATNQTVSRVIDKFMSVLNCEMLFYVLLSSVVLFCMCTLWMW